MSAVLVTGPTVMQDSLFFPTSGHNHRQYSFLPTHVGRRHGSEWVNLDAQGVYPS